jgi:hypothetical protein
MLARLLWRRARRHARDPTGNPHDTEPWEWRCGFYPGSRPGECTAGTAETFDQARAEFEEAWRVFLSKRTESDFQAWRAQRDWTERKYALWDAGKRLEPPSYGPGKPASRFMKCPCGEVFAMYEPAATSKIKPSAQWRWVNLVSNKMCSFSRISPVFRLASWSPPQASPRHGTFRAVSEN